MHVVKRNAVDVRKKIGGDEKRRRDGSEKLKNVDDNMRSRGARNKRNWSANVRRRSAADRCVPKVIHSAVTNLLRYSPATKGPSLAPNQKKYGKVFFSLCHKTNSYLLQSFLHTKFVLVYNVDRKRQMIREVTHDKVVS